MTPIAPLSSVRETRKSAIPDGPAMGTMPASLAAVAIGATASMLNDECSMSK